MMSLRLFGLIGYPLKHSFSPGYFAEKFKNECIEDARYDLYELKQISDFTDLKSKNLQGLNVTIPYKEKVIPLLDKLSDEAKEIKAVNTIKFTEEGLVGYNTDCFGFSESLKMFYRDQKPKRALILGTGGASKAVKYALDNLGISSSFVSRSNNYLTYSELSEEHLEGEVLIVNTTPLGTWPDVDSFPAIPYQFIGPEHYLYDLVYNPEKTTFLKKGESRGAKVKNGYDMLKLQAEKSWEIWNK